MDNAEKDGGELMPLSEKKSNQKQKASIDNAKEDRGDLMPSLKKNSNICKYSAIHFELLVYF